MGSLTELKQKKKRKAICRDDLPDLLLKPTGNACSQVILMGKVNAGNMSVIQIS